MRNIQGAAALALASTAAVAFGQECPPGYKKGIIEWASCEIQNSPLQCATIQVPRDWTAPNSGESLDLRLIRYPAAKDTVNPRSIIMNPGGPGNSGINQVRTGGKNYQDVVGNSFHIVGLDPRGVGQSVMYDCPSNKNSSGSYYTEDGRVEALQYFQGQAQLCADKKYRSDLVGTAFVARDINAIVERLGEDQMIRYWGFSYGTLLGATVANMFPTKIARLIIDGNINPTDYYRGLGDESTADFDKGVTEFFRQCAEAKKPACAVADEGMDGPQLQKKFDTEIEKAGPDGSFSIRKALFDTLYYKTENAFIDFSTTLSNWYADRQKAAQNPNGKRKLDWDPAYDEKDDKWQVPEALDAITCGDVITRYQGSTKNFAEWLDIYTKTGQFHSKYSGDIAIPILYQCSTWLVDAKEKPVTQFRNIKTENPILVLQSTFDPVTPLASAKNVTNSFIGAQLFVNSGVGHCSNANPSNDLDLAIGEYMREGTFPAPGTQYQPDVPNVFFPRTTRKVDGPNVKRNMDTPRIWANQPFVIKRQDNVPAGCTKIGASSSAVASASSSAVVSSVSSVVASTTAVQSASSSAVASSDISSMAPASSSVPPASSSVVPSASSDIASASSSAVMSASSSAVISASSVVSASSDVMSASSSAVISASSSAVVSAGSSVVASASSSAIILASSSTVASASASAVISASSDVAPASSSAVMSASSAVVSASSSAQSPGSSSMVMSASPSAVATASSSAVVSDSSSIVASASSGMVSASSSVVAPASLSAVAPASSSAPVPGSSSAVMPGGSSAVSSIMPSAAGVASSQASSGSASVGPSSARSSMSAVSPSSGSAALVSSVSSAIPSVSISPVAASASSGVVNSPSSVSSFGGNSPIASASSPNPYGNGYPAPSGPSSAMNSANNYGGNFGSSTIAASSSPCPTLAWSSQSGYVPVTQTYTTTWVQTITQCRGTKPCPLNASTPTAVITKTRTRSTVVAVPSTTVYVTQVVDVCSTGLTTSTVTVTETCKRGCTTRPTGPPTGWTTTLKFCHACATPSTVTVTYCSACISKPSSAAIVTQTPASPQGPASIAAVRTRSASAPGYVPPQGSNPAVPVYPVPSKPSVPAGNNSTIVQSAPPAIGTDAKSTTLRTNPASAGGYGCSGANCPTTTKPVQQFTGAAAHAHIKFPFVLPGIFAGLALFV